MLRISVVPFTLDQPKINDLCKYVPTLMTIGILMQKKIGKVCNETRHSNPLFFTHLGGGELFT